MSGNGDISFPCNDQDGVLSGLDTEINNGEPLTWFSCSNGRPRRPIVCAD